MIWSTCSCLFSKMTSHQKIEKMVTLTLCTLNGSNERKCWMWCIALHFGSRLNISSSDHLSPISTSSVHKKAPMLGFFLNRVSNEYSSLFAADLMLSSLKKWGWGEGSPIPSELQISSYLFDSQTTDAVYP